MSTKQDPHLYQEIAESLRRRIAAGELAPGNRLPAVRDLAAQWQCTPGTISRAYAILADEGLVQGHRGGGTRVIENVWPEQRPFLRQAQLINQAERFLLEAIGQGHTPHQTQAALSAAIARWMTWEAQPQTPSSANASPILRFVGSHDSLVELLLQQLGDAATVQFSGSLGGLMALARGEAEVAGIHLWDEATDSYNLPFVTRILPNQRLALVTVAKRNLGLITAANNPQAISTLADLTRPNLRWINRQTGSGTRVWLDAQLGRLGIVTAEINGYTQVKSTHLALAQAIAEDAADAGLGIYSAAIAFGLDFIPLTQEVYQLVIPEAVWPTAVCQSLLAGLRAPTFAATGLTMGGYDTAVSGETIWL